MQVDTFQAVVGGYFVVMGMVMLIFHKDAKAFHEDWFGFLRQYLPLMPSPRLIEVAGIVFGILSIIGGSIVVLLALPIE
jgi:hypothetical protein